ncbi:GDSL-type esterase/lipase family protein [Mucilaginibacter sp. PAMB04168]|uniref:SGNH/GDSL hydrolase family protein n=1 Tax=Mucilaginibacter sp. PAMB04168 TaxID=3138567 RepID=UPI0031F68B05
MKTLLLGVFNVDSNRKYFTCQISGRSHGLTFETDPAGSIRLTKKVYTGKQTLTNLKYRFMRTILFYMLVLTAVAGCKTHKLSSGGVWRSVSAPTDRPDVPGSLQDQNLRFVGRWDFSGTNSAVSYWGGAYVKTAFSGTTAQMVTGHRSNFFVKIDNGPWTSLLGVGDTVNLTPNPLTSNWHTLTVAQGKDYDYVFDFRGFVFDKGAQTNSPSLSPVLIEYIGDSITAGYTDEQANVSDYAWIASELLGTEHTQIAYPGINLASGYGRVKGNGMDWQYTKARSLKYSDAADWDFKRYAPAIVLINLGTNDNNNKVPDSTFMQAYVSLMKTIRHHFPKTKIFAMRTFLGVKQQPTINAVNQMVREGDKRVFYLDTSGWITPKTSDYNDSAHPSVSGQQKAARLLAEKLKSYL